MRWPPGENSNCVDDNSVRDGCSQTSLVKAKRIRNPQTDIAWKWRYYYQHFRLSNTGRLVLGLRWIQYRHTITLNQFDTQKQNFASVWYTTYIWPSLWSGGQNSCLQPLRSQARFSEKQWIWSGVHWASWGWVRSYLKEKVVTPV
jgi:hypothetical protein